MRKLIDLTGKTFGRLVVIERAANRGKEPGWLCQCVCGNQRIVRSSSLKSGMTTSCVCYRKELLTKRNLKHSHSHRGRLTPEYRSWIAAKDRCFNPKRRRFKDYGGRGITMCQKWRDSFEAFLAHIGPRSPGLTLDRVDNNKNYEPGSVRWATPKEQRNNRRPSPYGKCTRCE